MGFEVAGHDGDVGEVELGGDLLHGFLGGAERELELEDDVVVEDFLGRDAGLVFHYDAQVFAADIEFVGEPLHFVGFAKFRLDEFHEPVEERHGAASALRGVALIEVGDIAVEAHEERAQLRVDDIVHVAHHFVGKVDVEDAEHALDDVLHHVFPHAQMVFAQQRVDGVLHVEARRPHFDFQFQR